MATAHASLSRHRMGWPLTFQRHQRVSFGMCLSQRAAAICVGECLPLETMRAQAACRRQHACSVVLLLAIIVMNHELCYLLACRSRTR
eukprot:3554335-Pyramimonas_sp.AAC.1